MDDLTSLGLEKYEVSMTEVMHDIAGHISNIISELPFHLKEPTKSKFSEYADTLTDEKDMIRCCDRRRILLVLTKALRFEIDGKVHSLLNTLSEIQRILYLEDDKRTPREVLRLHNCSFQHFVLMKELFDLSKLSKKMSRDLLFGKYMHNLMVHAPLQYRIISGSSINCEGEERIFNMLKFLTSGKTNYRDGHVIGNMIVRIGYRERHAVEFEHDKKYNSLLNDIERLGRSVAESQTNSLFEYKYIENNSEDWQSHLERIADFLVFGEGVWWKKTEFGIEFYDSESPDQSEYQPKLHHFRSHSIGNVIDDLSGHWKTILHRQITIPAARVWIGGDDEPARFRSTAFSMEQSSSSLHRYHQHQDHPWHRLHQLYQWTAMSYDYELSNDCEPVEDENDYNVEKDIVEDEIDDKEEIDENMTSNFQLLEPLEETMEKSGNSG